MSSIELPKPTRKRLLVLCQLLKQIDPNKSRLTSVEISELTGWKTNQIRQDIFQAMKISGVEFKGGVSNGYDVKLLYEVLSRMLGIETSGEEIKKCCILGLGRIGSALLDESIFEDSGWRVVAGFDSNVNRVEILRSTFPLYPSYEMASIVKKEKIEACFLCVADKEALKMAERVFECGIKAVVNMTNIILPKKDGFMVKNCNPVVALKELNIN